jgi:N-acyl homoserine lactone hydrolase
MAASILRGAKSGGPEDAIPILSYVVEHDNGHIVIDTGGDHAAAKRVRSFRIWRHMFEMSVEPNDEIGPQMRARGLRPEDVRLVLPTHLHVDHSAGVGHFPDAEILVHRTEWDSRNGFGSHWKLQEESWPPSLEPKKYDLGPDPYGPFDASLPLTDKGDVVALPTPGHTKGHVAIAVRTADLTLLFTGDHLIRQSRYAADLARGNESFYVEQRLTLNVRLSDDTNRRLRAFIEQYPTLILPTHDADAAENIARWEPLRID